MSEATFESRASSGPPPRVVTRTSLWTWLFGIGLLIAVILLFLTWMTVPFLMAAGGASTQSNGVIETFESGDASASRKVAIIDIVGTISPPLTGSVLDQIEAAKDDDDVVGVMLRIDSPGGLVADSHQIYHRLIELSNAKPVYASFGRLAASGGYYVAMGVGQKGRIYSEPTTWTGSIGVIIPHYEVDQLADKWGVEVKPLTTGPFKDALSPFKDIGPEEMKLWEEIITDAYDRFVGVIDTNRTELAEADVRAAATGQIFTSQQALDRKLVDAIGFEEEAVDALIAEQSLGTVRVVRYGRTPTLLDVLAGNVKTNATSSNATSAVADRLASAFIPQPLYLFGWPTVAP